jgi:hypothetical protein
VFDMPSTSRSSAKFAAWAASALREIKRGETSNAPVATWTPTLAGGALIDALRWARTLPRVGPAGFGSTSGGFSTGVLDDETHAQLFGLREIADPDEPPLPMRIIQSPAMISRHENALSWCSRYIAASHPQSARITAMWAGCKARGRPFNLALRERGIDRSLAYRWRDRGLVLISTGLDRDGVPLI